MQDLEDGTEDNYKIIFPDSSNHEVLFPGVVSSVSLNSPIDGVHTMDITIKIVGTITWPT